MEKINNAIANNKINTVNNEDLILLQRLQGVYSTEIPNFPGNINQGGLFGGRYTAGAQLSLAPTNNIDVGIHYLYSHSPDNLLGGGIGDSQLIITFCRSILQLSIPKQLALPLLGELTLTCNWAVRVALLPPSHLTFLEV